MDRQPTETEIRKLWGWCEFEPSPNLSLTGQPIDGKWYPAIDLNNLFKYAMPKLDQAKYYKVLSSIFLKTDDPAFALFWAIMEVQDETANLN